MLASSDGVETHLAAAQAADEGFALVRIGDAYTRFANGDLSGARKRAVLGYDESAPGRAGRRAAWGSRGRHCHRNPRA